MAASVWVEGETLHVAVSTRSPSTVGALRPGKPVSVTTPGIRGPRGPGLPIVFNRDGPAQVKVGVNKYAFAFEATLTAYHATMGVGLPPVGSDLTADILVNGSVVATLTMPDGDEWLPPVPLNIPVSEGDYITVDITAVGSTSAGSNLTIYIQYQ